MCRSRSTRRACSKLATRLLLSKTSSSAFALLARPPTLPREERTALSQLALVVRKKLEALAGGLDQLASAEPVTSSGGDHA